MGAYSGALTRSATFAFRPPVLGVDPRHEHPDPQPDPFSPQPDTPPAQTGDVWQPEDVSAHTEMRDEPIHHWGAGVQQPVPSNVYSDQRNVAAQLRMLASSAVQRFRPDTRVPYRHATQGHHIQYVPGREPVNAGSTVPDDMAYLVMGRNSYDQTNLPNEVYGSGGEGNVGRYRLGVDIEDWGLYETPTGRFGQDAELRAYESLHPQFPVDKPPIANPAPQTPSSSGTTNWLTPAFGSASLFSLPAETALTDYELATEAPATASEFDDGGRM